MPGVVVIGLNSRGQRPGALAAPPCEALLGSQDDAT